MTDRSTLRVICHVIRPRNQDDYRLNEVYMLAGPVGLIDRHFVRNRQQQLSSSGCEVLRRPRANFYYNLMKTGIVVWIATIPLLLFVIFRFISRK